jgi:hypothetical protein
MQTPPHILQRSETVSKMCVFLEISDLRCRLVFHPTSDANRLRPMLCRCLINGQFSVMSPTKILKAASVSISSSLGLAFSATFSADYKQSPSSMRRSVVTWSEDPKTYHKKLYSEPNPMEGEIEEDRNPGGWMGWTAIAWPYGSVIRRTVLKTGSHGKIFFNRP